MNHHIALNTTYSALTNVFLLQSLNLEPTRTIDTALFMTHEMYCKSIVNVFYTRKKVAQIKNTKWSVICADGIALLSKSEQ
jgi:hypothetical protein